MAINFPTSLDNFTNPSSGNTLDSPSHSLQHSDINDAVEAMQRKVGVGTAVAGSASAGQVLTISAAGTSTWSTPTPGGLVQIVPTSVSVGSGSGSVDANGNITFTGASSITFNGAFSSTYDDYKLVLKITAATAVTDLLGQLTASGTPLTTSTYDAAYFAKTFGVGASVSSANTSLTSWIMSGVTNSSTTADYGTYEFSNPFATKYKSFIGFATRQDGYLWLNGGRLQTSTSSYDGMKLFVASGTISGNIRVYGYKN